jgi:hypothetical protein
MIYENNMAARSNVSLDFCLMEKDYKQSGGISDGIISHV